MTTIVYFVIAGLALAGALLLLWLDRNRSERVHHQRAVWGERHGFKFRETDNKLRSAFRRASMDVPDHVEVVNVAYGVFEGAESVVFDLAETGTIAAVRRPSASSVTVDLRYEDVLAPAETDVELLGAMGSRVMFASNLEAARRVCDRRMVALATKAPDFVEILWNEGSWALGSMPLTSDDEQLDVLLATVRHFADYLRVLPPVVDPQDAPDPRDPHGPTRPELADEKTDGMRDKRRRERAERDARRREAESEEFAREEIAREERDGRPLPLFDDEDAPAAPPRPRPIRRPTSGPVARPGGAPSPAAPVKAAPSPASQSPASQSATSQSPTTQSPAAPPRAVPAAGDPVRRAAPGGPAPRPRPVPQARSVASETTRIPTGPRPVPRVAGADGPLPGPLRPVTDEIEPEHDGPRTTQQRRPSLAPPELPSID